MISKLASLYKQTTVTNGDTKDRDILIVTSDYSASDWIQSVRKAIERRDRKVSGRNRNAPCPCGCGAKAKRCRGRM